MVQYFILKFQLDSPVMLQAFKGRLIELLIMLLMGIIISTWIYKDLCKRLLPYEETEGEEFGVQESILDRKS